MSLDQLIIIYNLVPHPILGFVPEAYTTHDNDGRLLYTVQKVFKHTAKSLGFEITDDLNTLLGIVDEFQEDVLVEKFNKKGSKRLKSLEKLVEDDTIKATVVAYAEKRINQFLSIIQRDGLPLGYGMQRRSFIEESRIQTGNPEPEPALYFNRTPDGINYRLSFTAKGKPLTIRDKDAVVLCNTPAWIVIDRQLFHIPDINGNMIKPFIQRDEVNIPNRFVNDYFRKFILRVAARASIEADGFEILELNKPDKCTLKLSENVLQGRVGIQAALHYDLESFAFNDKNPQRTRLYFNEEVTIKRYIRDFKAEKHWLDTLTVLGLQEEDGLFVLEDKTSASALISWLVKHKQLLQNGGFELAETMFADKTIRLVVPTLQLSLTKDNDWFDIHGDVAVGEFVFPFHKLARNIRDNDPYYKLPDDSYFIIPDEWMAEYSSLFQWAKTHKESVRLARSQFKLIEHLGLGDEEDLIEADDQSPYVQPEGLQAELRPYQVEGVRWMLNLKRNKLGGCLADDMGLGKTLQTITLLMHARAQRKVDYAGLSFEVAAKQGDLFQQFVESRDGFPPLNVLIILPASLVFNWKRELYKFAPALSVYQHTGQQRNKSVLAIKGFDVVLTTYQTALRDLSVLSQIEWHYIILDESQQIKNKDSKLFTAVNAIPSDNRITLTGTPIENALSDLWAQMQFINPELLGNFNFFKKHFIAPIEKQDEPEKREELRRMVSPYILRRTKEAVAKDLPELSRQVFYTEMPDEQRKLYEREKSSIRNYILESYKESDSKSRMHVVNALLRLRQIANHPQLIGEENVNVSGKFDDITNHLLQIKQSGNKALLFSSFVKHLELYKTWLEAQNIPYAWLTGETAGAARTKAVDLFQNNPDVPFFLISIKAGGTGLNLPSADYVIIADPWWNPAVEEQAISRAHRIGREDKVMAIKFIAQDTIEEKILKLQERKQKLADDIIGQDQKMLLNKEELVFLVD